MRERDHVDNVFSLTGGALWGGVVTERAGQGIFLIQLTPASQRPGMPAGQWIVEAQQAVRELKLPGVRISARPPQIRGLRFTTGDSDLVIGISGPELDTLQELAAEVRERLRGIDGLEGLDMAGEEFSPQLEMRVDRDRASEYGLSVREVGEAIRAAVDGEVATRYVDGNQEYDVRVRLPYDQVGEVDQLGNLQLFRYQGEPLLLRDLASLEPGQGPDTIDRENQSRIVRVEGDINTRINDVGSIMAEVDERLADLDMPERYNLIYGGQWETIQDTQREVTLVMLLAGFLVFVVLAVQYERLSNPLVIMTAAPLALVGVSLMLWSTGTPVSAPVLIGLVLLIGIVVNNAILLVEYIERGRQLEGLDVRSAIIEAGSVRLRPILMTTLTTVLGMTPLAIGIGDGAEIMRPLALTVVGGLLFSMLLTLLVVPCLYLIINGAAERLGRRLSGSGDSTG